jgi:hypothetical protein
VRLFVWMALGAVIYFTYGRRRAVYGQPSSR